MCQSEKEVEEEEEGRDSTMLKMQEKVCTPPAARYPAHAGAEYGAGVSNLS